MAADAVSMFSYGLVLAQSCRLSRVAQHLGEGHKAGSIERRLQRWLANGRIEMAAVFEAWIGWVVQHWGQAALLVLVDETKLGEHLSVMVVSAYYRGSAIPLIWRAYRLQVYQAEGQVALLTDLLRRLRDALPKGIGLLLLADRGLGTSPTWQQRLTELGRDYLVRVQSSTRFRLPNGTAQPLAHLVGYGQCWQGWGLIFKKVGWLWRSVYLRWEVGYAQPWCLVSNRRDCPPTSTLGVSVTKPVFET